MIDTSQVTDKNLEDLVTTAWYGGITYWAEEVTEDEFSGQPARTLMALADREDTESEAAYYFLDAVTLREAYAKLVDLDQPFVNRQIHNYFLNSWRDRNEEDGVDMGEIDAEAADAWVQVACFNQLVYG